MMKQAGRAEAGSGSVADDKQMDIRSNGKQPEQQSTRPAPSAGSQSNANSPTNSFHISAPTISLPKGGGAIRGIGEKFAANPVTGTGSMTIPIATSPGRSGFGPQLALSYDSGSGNGPFGFGWSLSLPAITRKTEKGLPKYLDAQESDIFLLAGAEDLVPEYDKDTEGHWILQDGEHVVSDHPRIVGGVSYRVRRYRPRVEGLFARIERWTNQANPAEVFWRSIAKDNVTTWYGKTAESRIADPAHPWRIFSWLICERHDDKGHVLVYSYTGEDSTGISVAQAHERNRTDLSRSAQRYLTSIRYGNHEPYLPELRTDAPWPQPPGDGHWYFETVFDYGEHALDAPTPHDSGAWTVRQDAFSSYRSGFEVRTYRLCRRVLMFHHFPEEPEVEANCLVRSTDFTYRQDIHPLDAQDADFSLLKAVTQWGYKRQPGGGYLKESLPPVEFGYSEARIDDRIHDVEADSLENLPIGLDGSLYHWVDLDGEGLSGIVTEQSDGWYYKRNLSPKTFRREADRVSVEVRFAPTELVAPQPSLAALGGGRQQLLDVDGNGRLELVDLVGPTPGYYERTTEGSWEPFTTFASLPNLAWQDPNLKFIDLTGDGHADVLISEDEIFTWYPSLAKEGFGDAERTAQSADDERGPKLVFADGEQTIFLADMSGDGLADLVRIRNGEVCYWPNLGYGQFGAKVTMDRSPCFDGPEFFDQHRLRLADIDGSGLTDLLYLHRDGVKIYTNQSGNRWTDATVLEHFPQIDNLAAVQVADLLGTGTACLVWSSPLPGEQSRRMRYMELMGGQKPYLLTSSINNLGAETTIQYAPSTKFYVQDRLAGRPWITKLPFPVYCVETVMVKDKWRQTKFSTAYSYHHGYFDGVEREFRGFGRVEQVDVESYGLFQAGNTASPYITDDHQLYQPPVKTITWFHTGAAVDRRKILSHFADEYFAPSSPQFQEQVLPEPDLAAQELTADEWREAFRACKGMMLRQEVYELDVEALEHPTHPEQRPVTLFSTAYHNCQIQRLQPRGVNRHAVFLATESEAITYHYELDLRHSSLQPDPRIAHTLNLRVDEQGNVLQTVAATYPRVGQFEDPSLSEQDLARIRKVQAERHVTYTETRYTNDVLGDDRHRLRVPCEVLTYDVTGIEPATSPYFTLEELRAYHWSDRYQATTEGLPIAEIPYQQLGSGAARHTRCVEHVRMLFFDQNLRDPLPLGTLNALGLPYETYKLALSEDLLTGILGDKLTGEVRRELSDPARSGYSSHPGSDTPGQWWVSSGIAGFADDAASHFYLPEQYRDPFGHVTMLQFDPRDLFVSSSVDALGNTTVVRQFDFRVLAPREIQDPNDNLSEVAFDVLGMPAAVTVKGKGDEADSLIGFTEALLNPGSTARQAFFTGDYSEAQARTWLGDATARHLTYFGEERRADGSMTWGVHPACACGIVRERHVRQLAAGEASPLQVGFEYSDGSGTVLVKKGQAEPDRPGGSLRWVASGKTVLNNKGKPVKQYESYFSESAQRFEEPREVGVTPIIYYDAAGRTIRTDAPDGSYSRVEFSPWHVATYDQNDTVRELGNEWYARHSATTASPEDRRAAASAALHADTPSVMLLDSLGRDVVAIAHNRVPSREPVLSNTPLLDRPWLVEKYLTFTKLDAEGKPLWIRDARSNLVMQYLIPPKPTRLADEPDQTDPEQVPAHAAPCYDIAGNLLFQHSMDGGDRWMLNDAAGKPMFAWDRNERQTDTGAILEDRRYLTDYDDLHRPTHHWLTINSATRQLIEQFQYGEALADAKVRNLRGQLHLHHDMSGRIEHVRHDFKGNLLEAQKILASAYDAPVIDWATGSPTAGLETETWTQITEYDALNRMTRQENWHREGRPPAIYRPRYNERGLLQGEMLTVNRIVTDAIRQVEYDAKGQKQRIDYGNGTSTSYSYDPQTFRLIHLLTTRTGGSDVYQDLSYTYDPLGNITQIRDDAQQTLYFRNRRVEPSTSYIYDALSRLIEATGREHLGLTSTGQPNPPTPPDQFNLFHRNQSHPHDGNAMGIYTERYLYDAVGNIDAMQHLGSDPANPRWTRNYRYADDSNRLLRTWYGNDELNAVGYDYDTHGSMLNLNRVPEDYRLRWDYRDMIHHVNLGGGGLTWYSYDEEKQRSRKVITSQDGRRQWERFYLGGMEVYRRYGTSGVVEEIETHHLFVGEQRALIVEDVLSTDDARLTVGVLYRYQYGNHLGSVALEMTGDSADPQIISCEEYHPYGTTAFQSTNATVRATAKRYRYTGMERDEETGLNYHTARYYLPWLGRWGSCDPAGLNDGSNIYCYVDDNPIGLGDPSGHFGVGDALSLAGGALRATASRVLSTAVSTTTQVISILNPGVGAMIAIRQGVQLTSDVIQAARQGGSEAVYDLAQQRFNPVYRTMVAGYETYQAAQRGDWRAVGQHGVDTAFEAVDSVRTATGAARGLGGVWNRVRPQLSRLRNVVLVQAALAGRPSTVNTSARARPAAIVSPETQLTVYRVQPRPNNQAGYQSNVLTGGGFRSMREGGQNLVDSNRVRLGLIVEATSPDDRIFRKALHYAQANRATSPIISTTSSLVAATIGVINRGRDPKLRGTPVELVRIRGPRDAFLDFERSFMELGGRLKRDKDAGMFEMGIWDLFVPPTGESRSGVRILGRSLEWGRK